MKPMAKAIICTIVAITGVLMHFVHESASFTTVAGYIFPATPSVWEHMKTILYPLLGLSVYLTFEKGDIEVFGGPVLAFLAAIPVQLILFFIYVPFTGHVSLAIDLPLYVMLMVAATLGGIQLSRSRFVKKYKYIFPIVATFMIVIFAFLTYRPMHTALFQPRYL